MTRKDHWATHAFHQFLLDRAHSPFSYAGNDCCTFAADCILAVTGIDIAEDFRGYSTELGALKAIKRVTDGSTVQDALVYCATKYGMPEWQAPLFAQRGDLVLVEDDGALISAIVHLNGREVVAPGEQGLKLIPITSVKRAWRVG